MPVMPTDVPHLLEAGLKTIFQEELKKLQPSYEKICTVVDTTLPTQKYGWVGQPPAIREFIDERVAKGLAEYGFTISDKTWEATLAIDRRTIENDQYGVIVMQVRQLARAMIEGVDKLAWTVLREANTGTYGRSWDNYDKDGNLISGRTIYFADTDHVYPEPSEYTTAQSNKGTAALSASNIWAAWLAMTTLKDDRGEYFENSPTMLIASPKLAETVHQLVSAEAIIPAAATSYVNTVPRLGLEPMLPPYWAADASGNTQNWALAKTDGVVKPLILQIFKPAANGQLFEFSALEGGSESGFMRDKYYYGIRGRWNIGYGDWRNFYLNVVA